MTARSEPGDSGLSGPVRTCLGCGKKRPKGELKRLVVGVGGKVEVDRAQRAPGRGGYLCGVGCLKAAAKRRAIVRALRMEAAVDINSLEAALASPPHFE